MIRFSANLGLLFGELPLRERFQPAAAAGFRVVEIWFPHLENLADLVKAKDKAGVQVLQFNMDRIDFAGGERGTLGIPEHRQRFRADLEAAIVTARQLGARQFNALAGNRSPNYSRAEQLDCLKDNLHWAAARLANTDLRLVVEPLSLELNPGYLLPRPSELFAIVAELGSAHVAVLYDIFHAHLAGDDLVASLRRYLPSIGHIQVADAPGRHQPGTGTINYRVVFDEIEALGYEGHVGLEYRPLGTLDEALRWLPKEQRIQTEARALKLA